MERERERERESEREREREKDRERDSGKSGLGKKSDNFQYFSIRSDVVDTLESPRIGDFKRYPQNMIL